VIPAALATAALLASLDGTELRRVDPVTLAPSGAAVRLDGRLYGGWTKRGTKLALGVTTQGRIQIVDGRRTRLLRTGRPSAMWALSWPREDRLLALGTLVSSRTPLVVLDPASGRVLRDTLIDGRVVHGAATAEGLALLLAPQSGIGDATLALVDAEGAERRIPLPGVTAGSEPAGQDPHPRDVMPGLAVRDGRAYVATDASVVDVDLVTGEQRTHAVAGARAAKRGVSQRFVAVVGPHQLAVSGRDVGEREAVSAGLRVVDTRTWGVKVIARGGAPVDVSPGGENGALPLPGGGFAGWPSPRGLALFTADGEPRVTALRKRSVRQVQIAGRYAYAVSTRPTHRTYVVELSSGRVVKTLPTAQPPRLLG